MNNNKLNLTIENDAHFGAIYYRNIADNLFWPSLSLFHGNLLMRSPEDKYANYS